MGSPVARWGRRVSMRAFVLALTLAVAILAGSSAPAQAAKDVQFGIQDDAWLEFGPGRLSDRVAELDRLGLDAVRVTLRWDRIERTPGDYDWRRSDRLLRTLDAHGLAPVVTLWGTPGWANGDAGPNVAPVEGSVFAQFATEAALRYRFVTRWVIWNEPNKAIWLKPASPETYVQKLLNPAYRGIKAVNRADRVAGGVTAPRGGQGGVSPVDFIRRMDAAGARLDVYAHHPYPVYPGDTPLAGGCSCKTITMATLEPTAQARREGVPVRPHLADGVRVSDEPARRLRRHSAASGAVHRRGLLEASTRHPRSTCSSTTSTATSPISAAGRAGSRPATAR